MSGVGREISIRALDPALDRFINDEEMIKGEESEQESHLEIVGTAKANPLALKDGVPQEVFAVDTSSMVLGEGGNGVLFCVRGVIVHWDPRTDSVKITAKFEAPCFVSEENKEALYTKLRNSLWNLDGEEVKPPEILKMVDRVRNIYERYLQRVAAEKARNSLLLFDGSLTGGTVDTPKKVLEAIACESDRNGNSIVAFSKKTKLKTAAGQKIASLLAGSSSYPIFLPVTNLLDPGMADEILGDVFVAKLCRLPIFFRVDVHAKSVEEAASNLLRSVYLEHGYPKPLIQAHVNCYFNHHDAMVHRVLLGKRSIFVREEFDIRRLLFGIYG